MATKSFLKNINIRNVAQSRNLLTALERAEQIRGKEVDMNRSVSEIRREQIKDFSRKIRW